MSKFSIDTKIYVSRLLETLEDLHFYEDREIFGEITNMDSFREDLENNILIKATENELVHGDPILDEEQFEEVVTRTVIESILEDMEKSGLIESEFSVDKMDTVYKKKDSDPEKSEDSDD
jgi:hypothetical protein